MSLRLVTGTIALECIDPVATQRVLSMFQDAHKNQTALEDAPNSAGESSWWSEESEAELAASDALPANSYADSLMDELFEDVDRILEHGVQVPPEPPQPEFVSLQPLSIPQMLLPPILMPRPQITMSESDDVGELVQAISAVEVQESSSAIDRLLLSAACVSIVACATLWFAFHRPSQSPTVATAPAPTAEQLEAQQNNQFLQYLERSLSVIDRKAEASRVATAVPGASPSANLPTVPVPGSAATPASGAPTVLERVYIPVYQPPQTLYPLPSVAPVAPPVAMAPAPVAPPVPVAPAAPAPVAPSAVAVAPSPVAPAVMHTLQGVMQLGDRSAALFEINGVTQRIYIGESIGGSGWMLVSISNQEAVIRRNGEVRSIYVGQQF